MTLTVSNEYAYEACGVEGPPSRTPPVSLAAGEPGDEIADRVRATLRAVLGVDELSKAWDALIPGALALARVDASKVKDDSGHLPTLFVEQAVFWCLSRATWACDMPAVDLLIRFDRRPQLERLGR